MATKSKFSIEEYNSFYDMELHEELIKQYEVEGLEGLLLSPRATKTTDASTGDVHYSTCFNCYNSMKVKESDNLPKHAIANGFAIGQVPTRILKNDDITEEMCALLAPIRPYAYLFAYSAGAHKSIKGHYSFFEMDLTHTGSVMNHFLKIGSNPMVYVVLNGRMTPKQKEKVRERAELDTSKMMQLMDWFVTESGHPAYAKVCIFHVRSDHAHTLGQWRRICQPQGVGTRECDATSIPVRPGRSKAISQDSYILSGMLQAVRQAIVETVHASRLSIDIESYARQASQLQQGNHQVQITKLRHHAGRKNIHA